MRTDIWLFGSLDECQYLSTLAAAATLRCFLWQGPQELSLRHLSVVHRSFLDFCGAFNDRSGLHVNLGLLGFCLLLGISSVDYQS